MSSRPVSAITLPSIALLRHHIRVPSSSGYLRKHLNRLSRSTLISLAQRWLSAVVSSEVNQPLQKLCLNGTGPSAPAESPLDEDQAYDECAGSLEEVQEIYDDLLRKTGVSKREVVDRILEIDWRDGLSLWQIATIDTTLLLGLDGSAKNGRWTALRTVCKSARESPVIMQASQSQGKIGRHRSGRTALGEVDANSMHHPHPEKTKQQEKQDCKTGITTNQEASSLPSLSIPALKRSLLHFLSPIAKIHITSHPLSTFPNLNLLRISSLVAPYAVAPHSPSAESSPLQVDDERLNELLTKSIWLAIPSGSPHVFVSFGNTATLPGPSTTKDRDGGSRSIGAWRRSVLDAFAKALSSSTGEKIIQLTGASTDPRSATRNQKSTQWRLQPTNLSAKGLSTLMALRGIEGEGACQGSWSIYSRSQDAHPSEPGPAKAKTPRLEPNPLDIDSTAALKSSEQLLSEAIGAHDRACVAEAQSSKANSLQPPSSTPVNPSSKRSATAANLDPPPQPLDAKLHKKRKLLAQARFGNSARADDGRGIERLTMRLQGGTSSSPLQAAAAASRHRSSSSSTQPEATRSTGPSSLRAIVAQAGTPQPDTVRSATDSPSASSRRSSGRLSSLSAPDATPQSRCGAGRQGSGSFGSVYAPDESGAGRRGGEGVGKGITVCFRGGHVFAGLRVMVEKGIVDGVRMPGWMTGEGAVSVGVVDGGKKLRGARALGF